MKKILLLFTIVFVSLEMQGQSISKQVLAGLGKSITNGVYTLNFTVGEPIIGMVQNGEVIQQGFWGSIFNDDTLNVTTLIDDPNEISVFPNPVIDYIQIKYKLQDPKNYTVCLFDIGGKEVLNIQKNILNKHIQINMRNLVDGTYLLVIAGKSSNYNKSFKIIKK